MFYKPPYQDLYIGYSMGGQKEDKKETEEWERDMVSKDLQYNADYPTIEGKQEPIEWVGSIPENEVSTSNNEPVNVKVEERFYSAPTRAKKMQKPLRVHQPAHYGIFPDMQVIDVIRKTLTEEEFHGFCKGNILKYRLRDKDDREEDYEKSKKYQSYLQDPTDI